MANAGAPCRSTIEIPADPPPRRLPARQTLLALVIVALQLQLAPPVADLRQCPPPWNGTNGTVAFMHIPKTAGGLRRAQPRAVLLDWEPLAAAAGD